MSPTASPHQPPVGRAPLHAVQVLGGASTALGGGAPSAGTAAHVRSLAEGLVARGVRVTVCAARDTELDHAFTRTGAHFAATRGDSESDEVASLREVCADADLVHAHGLRAGLVAALALGRRRREVPLVVTWHTRPQPAPEGPGRADGARQLMTRLLKRRVARAAAVVLGVTTDLVDAARESGARDARLAPVALPGPRREGHPLTLTLDLAVPSGPGSPDEPGAEAGGEPVAGPETVPVPGPGDEADTGAVSGADAHAGPETHARPEAHAGPVPFGPEPEPPDAGGEEAALHKVRADIGAVGRPLLVAVGRLDRRNGYDTVLTASRAWRGLDPPPLLAVAGEGPERAALQGRIEAEALPVRLLGVREDALRLLAAADLALVTTGWEGRSLLAQEALRAGVPLVATAVGGTPELVGEAAVLIPYGDPDSLASAVTALLADPGRRAELAASGRARAATWPTENDTVAQVLSVYDELTRAPAL